MTDPPAYFDISPPPNYDCTVYKEGYVRLKQELGMGGFKESKNRSWSTVYFVLRGTLLQIYKQHSDTHPLYHISMLKANCGIALDYLRHSNVLRLRLGTKEQYLIRPQTVPETISWFEHIQSSANISTDIDKRRMPRVLTLARESELQNHTRTVTLVIGKTHAIVPILQCQRNV
ncbi:unnamed protein product [Mucor hiemalis]